MLTPRPKLDNKWIESVRTETEIYGSDEFHCTNIRNWTGWLDKEERDTFAEAFKNRTETQIELWYRDHEYEDVLTHTEDMLKNQLIEKELYNKVPSEDQLDEVNQVISDAGVQLAYLYGESWYKFLKEQGALDPNKYKVTVIYQVPHIVEVEADNEDFALDEAMDQIGEDGGWYHDHEIEEVA